MDHFLAYRPPNQPALEGSAGAGRARRRASVRRVDDKQPACWMDTLRVFVEGALQCWGKSSLRLHRISSAGERTRPIYISPIHISRLLSSRFRATRLNCAISAALRYRRATSGPFGWVEKQLHKLRVEAISSRPMVARATLARTNATRPPAGWPAGAGHPGEAGQVGGLAGGVELEEPPNVGHQPPLLVAHLLRPSSRTFSSSASQARWDLPTGRHLQAEARRRDAVGRYECSGDDAAERAQSGKRPRVDGPGWLRGRRICA